MRKQVLIRLVITWGWSSLLHRANPAMLIPLSLCFLPASMNFVFFRFTMRLLYYCSVNWVSASSLLMVFPSITMGFSSSSPSSAYEVDASKTDISFTITFCNWNRWFRRRCSWLSHLCCSGVLCSISIHTLGFSGCCVKFSLIIAWFTSASSCMVWWPWLTLLRSTLNCRSFLLRRVPPHSFLQLD